MPQPEVTIAVNTLPFWSRLLLQLDLRWNGTDPTRVVIANGRKIQLFNYKQGEGNVTALSGDRATSRDTILQTGAQTRGGALYDIGGLSFTKDGPVFEQIEPTVQGNPRSQAYWPGMSTQAANGAGGPLCPTVEDQRSLESFLLALFLGNLKVNIYIDGTKRTLEMGPQVLYPGIGGAKDSVQSTNGDTFNGNFMEIKERIVWNPAGSSDSNLIVELECTRDVIVPCWTTPNGTATGGPITATNPVIAGAVATAIGRNWTLPIVLNFHGREEGPTSRVS